MTVPIRHPIATAIESMSVTDFGVSLGSDFGGVSKRYSSVLPARCPTKLVATSHPAFTIDLSAGFRMLCSGSSRFIANTVGPSIFFGFITPLPLVHPSQVQRGSGLRTESNHTVLSACPFVTVVPSS